MKIAFLSRTISPPWTEGPKNIVKHIVDNVVGFDFLVFGQSGHSFDKENIFSKQLTTDQNAFSIPFLYKLKMILYLLFSQDIDIYHLVFVPRPFTSFIFKMISRMKGANTIQTITNTHDKLNKNIYFADQIVVLSNHSKKLMAEIGIEATVIPPSAALPAVSDFGTYPEISDQGKKLVLYAGDLKDKKAIQNLIDIVSSKQLRAEIKFVIATRDKNKEEIENKKALRKRLKNQNVVFVDNVTNMFQLINTCHISIFPVGKVSAKLEIPMVLLECLALGKPIIVSDIHPLDEILIREAGYMLDPKQPEQFVDKINKLSIDTALYNTFSDAGRQIVAEKFSAKKTAELYRSIYQNLK